MKTPEEFIKDYKNLNWSIKDLIEKVQIDAYNSCLIGLGRNKILPNKKVNIIRYRII